MGNKGSYYQSRDESDMRITPFSRQYCYTEEMKKTHFLLQRNRPGVLEMRIAEPGAVWGSSNKELQKVSKPHPTFCSCPCCARFWSLGAGQTLLHSPGKEHLRLCLKSKIVPQVNLMLEMEEGSGKITSWI